MLIRRTSKLIRVATLLIGILLSFLAPIVQGKDNVFAAETGGYPYASAYKCGTWSTWCMKGDPDIYSPYLYAYRNCTDYVAWKVSTFLGRSPTGLRNAGLWDDNATSKGFLNKGSNNPEPGDAAVWNGGYGHVAFVESVNADGSVNVTEYNGDANISGLFGRRDRVRADAYVDFDGQGKNTYGGVNLASAGSVNSDTVTDGQPLVATVMSPNNTAAGYARGADGRVYRSWQEAPGESWQGWVPLGEIKIAGAPIATVNKSNGAHAIFARGANNHAYTAWQPYAGSGTWYWADLGGDIASNLEISETIMGSSVLFARNSAGELIHAWQPTVGGTWTGWYGLGGNLQGDPEIMRNSNGSLAVFARGKDNQLWHKWQVAPGSYWTDWVSLGGSITSSPSFIMNNNGIGIVFARDSSGSLTHTWQWAPGSSWRPWERLNTPKTSSGVTVTKESSGSLAIYYVREDGQLMTDWQWAPGSSWNSSPIGSLTVGTPSILQGTSAMASAYGPTKAGIVTTTWQTTVGGAWNGYATLGVSPLKMF